MIVLDASIWIKILVPERNESGSEEAVVLWRALESGEDELVQPPHWLAEILAVLSRLVPESAGRDADLLNAMEVPVRDTPEIYSRAVRLATHSGQHLFDTLYHAVALSSEEGVFVTADKRYYNRMASHGHISLLPGS